MTQPTYVSPTAELEVLADALGDPTRRAIFKFVLESGEPVTASEVGTEFDIHRTVARAHLERLVDANLLEASTRHRAEGGRPPKIYSRGDRRLDLQVPMRQYELLAELLLTSLSEFGPAGEVMVRRAGYDFGRRLGTTLPDGHPRDLLQPLVEGGADLAVEGSETPDGEEMTVRMRNCLFREVAAREPHLVCALDRAIMEGLLSTGDSRFVLADAVHRTGEEDTCTFRFLRDDSGDAQSDELLL